MGGFWVGQMNMHAMLIALQNVHHHCVVLFGLTELRTRLKMAENVMKYLMDHALGRYDNRHDQFIAPGYVWDFILLVKCDSLSWFFGQRFCFFFFFLGFRNSMGS